MSVTGYLRHYRVQVERRGLLPWRKLGEPFDLLRHECPQAELVDFRFRAIRPTFDINKFYVCGAPQADGKTIHLWARNHQGWLTMDATATTR